jgi:hypothetical protein
MTYKTWKEAHTEAVKLARLIGHDVGLWAGKEYGIGPMVYKIRSLPKPENRYGYELRCEVVTPRDPF